MLGSLAYLPDESSRIQNVKTNKKEGNNMNKHLLLAGIAVVCLGTAYAGGSSTYKCQYGTRTEYSDEPCMGAKVVDTTPTQGMDKSTGVSRKGKDVQRVEQREALATAIRPLTGMNAEELEKAGRRQQLPVAHQRQCAALDGAIPAQEMAARNAADTDKAKADVKLYRSRKQFKTLKC